MDDHSTTQRTAASTGQNEWLVEEMYAQYQNDPHSVSESWRDFFADYRPMSGLAGGTGELKPGSHAEFGQRHRRRRVGQRALLLASAPATTSAAGSANGAGAAAAASRVTEAPGDPIRGVAARIVENMEASLEVPTATSFREVPARLLEVNRKVINGYLARSRGGKVSYTHLIGFAVVRAIADSMPAMNANYTTDADGKPRIVRNAAVNLGIAVDLEKSDGSRTLMVPAIKGADAMDFRTFVESYEELIRRVRAGKVTADDLSGVTVSLTNPGGFGTLQSVPRLMPGQGLIVGVGTIDYPTEFQASDPTSSRRPRCLEGDHAHLHLRPPHHPGRRVRPVPAQGTRTAHRRGPLLRRCLPLHGRALRGRPVAPRRHARRPDRRHARKAGRRSTP